MRHLFLAAALAGLPLSSRGSLTAWVGSNGSVQFSDGTFAYGSLSPGLFEVPWNIKNFEGGSKIVLKDDKTQATCQGEVLASGSGLRAKYSIRTSQDYTINMVKLSLGLDIGRWSEGRWAHDKGTGIIPKTLGEMHLTSEVSKSFLLTAKDGSWLKIASTQPVRMMLQDSRQWSPALELRIGQGFGDQGGLWKAAEPVNFDIEITASQSIAVQYDRPVTLRAGPDWIPLENKTEIVAGSALDFSGMGLSEGPAGKYGRVVVGKSGRFEFEKKPGIAQRFYGVNFCFSALYLEKDKVDRLMDRLVRLGYNSIRIHHYENELVGGWGSQRNSLDFMPEKLDQLDYFFAAAKARGLYVTTDLYVSRPVKPAEVGLAGEDMNFKLLIPVHEPSFENWKAFSTKLLTHVNPYTRMAWKDDPALAWLVPANEDNFLNYMADIRGRYKELWTAAWNKWRRAKRGAAADIEIPAATASNGEGLDLALFMADTHLSIFRRQRDFLRKELKCPALLSGLNGWTDTLPQQATRAEYDYVDNHFYWDHPGFLEKDWQLPSRGWSGNGPAIASGGGGAKDRTASRLLDRPFTLSEYNFSAPNSFRAEGGLLTGAAAALQGWSVLWRFAYSHDSRNIFEPSVNGYFDMVTDPVNQATERAAILLFLRGDLKEAPHAVALAATRDELLDKAGGSTSNLGFSLNELTFLTKTGTYVAKPGRAVPADIVVAPTWSSSAPSWAGSKFMAGDGLSPDLPAAVLARMKAAGWIPDTNATDFAAGRVQSETGEILLDSRNVSFQVATERTFAFVGRDGSRAQASGISLGIDGAPAAVFASSLDGKALPQSGRILFCHVTDVQASERRYRDGKMSILEDWGKVPHLLRAGTCAVQLAHPKASALKVWALATDGSRVGLVDSAVKNGALSFTCSSQGPAGGCLYYEIAEK